MEERSSVLMPEQQIVTLIDILKEYLHLPEVVEFHATTQNKPPAWKKKTTNAEATLMMTNILEEISNITGYTKEQIKGHCRKQHLADVRWSLAMLSSNIYGCSDAQISSFLDVDLSLVRKYRFKTQHPQKAEIYLMLKKILEKKPWKKI